MDIKHIEVRDASEAVEKRVRAWFERKGGVPGALGGSRSIHLPHPEKSGFALKIKGAGLNGGPIVFGKYSRTGPAARLFDFDGRAMLDVASGHDNAFLGAASFQQAATEFNVSQMIAAAGMRVVPCLGFGRIETSEHASWFSIFEWHRNWKGISLSPGSSIDDYLDAYRRIGKDVLDLAVGHDLIGYHSYVRDADGSYLLKDLHPFRQADPISMSQLSWTMQVLFALNMLCQAVRHFSADTAEAPSDIESYPLKALLPDAGAEDYEALRSRIVKPYIVHKPEDFSPLALVAALRSTRVGDSLLDLCPPRYTRW